MATPGGNGGPTQSPSAQPGQAQLKVVGQYIKDLSFKNPNAPRSLAPTETQPAINIQINVIVQQLAPTHHEVALKLEGKAESAGSVRRNRIKSSSRRTTGRSSVSSTSASE